MRFSPFAFIGNKNIPNYLPSGVVVNLWQGNFVNSGTTWTNLVSGNQNATSVKPMVKQTINNVTGVYSNNTTSPWFKILHDGIWDASSGYTIMTYMYILPTGTTTTNYSLWGKQTSSTNGFGLIFTNQPYLQQRNPSDGSGNGQIQTGNINQPALYDNIFDKGNWYSYAVASTGKTDGKFYENGGVTNTSGGTIYTTVTGTDANNSGNTLNNLYDFTFGLQQSYGGCPTVTGYLNRLLIFNRRLSDSEVLQTHNYMKNNP